jgi:hypothetical protein
MIQGMEGAKYQTNAANVQLFDRIIGSACYIPNPRP